MRLCGLCVHNNRAQSEPLFLCVYNNRSNYSARVNYAGNAYQKERVVIQQDSIIPPEVAFRTLWRHKNALAQERCPTEVRDARIVVGFGTRIARVVVGFREVSCGGIVLGLR